MSILLNRYQKKNTKIINTFIQTILFLIYITIFFVSFFTTNFLWLFTIFELIIVALLIILEYKRNLIYASPLIFWYIFWLVIISIARIDLHVYEFNSSWQYDLLKNIVINTCVFYFVYQFLYLVLINKRIKHVKIKFKMKYSLYKIIKLILIVSIFAFILNCIVYRTIPQLSANVDIVRRDFVTGIFFSIVNITRFVYGIIPIYIYKETRKKNKKVVTILAVSNVFLTFLSGWRTYLFQIIILFGTSQILLYSYQIKTNLTKVKSLLKQQKKMIFTYLIIAIFFIGVIAVTRAKTLDVSEYISYTLEQIYLYFAPSFLNYQTAMYTLVPNNNFVYTTEALWGLFISSSKMPGFIPLSFSIGAFNVSTYLLHPYADFGEFGTYLWSGIIALIAVYYFTRSINNYSSHNLVMLGIINMTIFNMHNGFFLRSSSVLIWFVGSVIIKNLCFKEQTR